MKSIKKRFKALLKDLQSAASGLTLITADVGLFSEINAIAEQVLRACEDLKLQTSQLDKTEFASGIVDAKALSALEEILDFDAISGLEERFFSVLGNDIDSRVGELLQQLLGKLEHRYAVMMESIRKIIALLDSE